MHIAQSATLTFTITHQSSMSYHSHMLHNCAVCICQRKTRTWADSLKWAGLYANLPQVIMNGIFFLAPLCLMVVRLVTHTGFTAGSITLCEMGVLLSVGGTFGMFSRAADQELGSSLSAFSEELDQLLGQFNQLLDVHHQAALLLVAGVPDLGLPPGPQQIIQVCETTHQLISERDFWIACCMVDEKGQCFRTLSARRCQFKTLLCWGMAAQCF